MTSSAWISGESSAAKAAWMPPCAFDELFAWSEPLVASATRAPARSAETAAASPEAPLPITSTSKLRADSLTGGTIPVISESYALFTDLVGKQSVDRAEELQNLARAGRARVRLVATALRCRLGDLGQLLLRNGEVAQAVEAAEERQLARARDSICPD